MKTIKLLALLVVTSLVFTSCEDDHDHDHDHDEELITNVIYTLTNGNDVVTLTFEDLDGEGGNAGTYSTSGPLTANTTYTGELKLENRTESPAEDISVEIRTEADEHEFFFSSSVAGITISKTDADGNGNPLGLETSVTTGAAGTGTITVILKHEPSKPNDGSASGAGGSTDVEITYTNVTVQ